MAPIPTRSIYEEQKTAQLSFRLGDRLKTNLSKISVMNRATVTDLINEALIEYAKHHNEDVRNYDKVFGENEGVDL